MDPSRKSLTLNSRLSFLDDLPADLLGDAPQTDDMFAPAPITPIPPAPKTTSPVDMPPLPPQLSSGPQIVLPSPQMRANRLQQARSLSITPVSTVRSLIPTISTTNIDDVVVLGDVVNMETSKLSFGSNLSDRDQYRKKVPLAANRTHRHWIAFTENLVAPESRPFYTLEQVSKHCSPEDAWIVINGNVYDVSQYLDYHPGGRTILLENCGKDGTELFNTTHSFVNHGLLLGKFHIGYLNKND